MSASNSRLNFLPKYYEHNFFSFFFLEMATDTDDIVQVWSHSTNQINANKTVTLNFKSQWIFNWNFFPMNLIKNWSDQATVYRLFTLCCPINSLWKSQSLFKSDLPFNLHILIFASTKEKANRLISNSRNKNWFFSDIHILIHWQCLPKGHFYSRVYFFCTPRPQTICFQCHARNHGQTKWHHWL